MFYHSDALDQVFDYECTGGDEGNKPRNVFYINFENGPFFERSESVHSSIPGFQDKLSELRRSNNHLHSGLALGVVLNRLMQVLLRMANVFILFKSSERLHHASATTYPLNVYSLPWLRRSAGLRTHWHERRTINLAGRLGLELVQLSLHSVSLIISHVPYRASTQGL